MATQHLYICNHEICKRNGDPFFSKKKLRGFPICPECIKEYKLSPNEIYIPPLPLSDAKKKSHVDAMPIKTTPKGGKKK